MSLPSYAVFVYEDGTEVEHFVNCGWFLTDEAVHNSIKSCKVPPDWVKVIIYGAEITKSEFENFVPRKRKSSLF